MVYKKNDKKYVKKDDKQHVKKSQLKNKNSKSKKKSPSDKKTVYLTKDQIEKAMKILNEKQTLKPYQVNRAKRYARKCKLPLYELQENGNIYNPLNTMSYLNITRHMRTCILNHDWNNLTKLLIIFFDAKQQNAIKLRNAFINLLNNPVAIKYNFLDEFLQMFVCCQTEDDKKKFMNRLLNVELIKFSENNVDKTVDEVLSD